MKYFIRGLIVLSFLFMLFSLYNVNSIMNNYEVKGDGFYKISKDEFDEKTKELAKKLNNQLIRFVVKKTLLIGSGSLSEKYYNINKYNVFDLKKMTIYIKKNDELQKKINKCLLQIKKENIEGVSKECNPLLEENLDYTLLEYDFNNFFNSKYDGKYFEIKKEKNEVLQEKTNWDYIYTIKNEFCKELNKSVSLNSFYNDYITKNKIKESLNKKMCETEENSTFNIFTNSNNIRNSILFFLLNKNIYIYPGKNNDLWNLNDKSIKAFFNNEKNRNKNILKKIDNEAIKMDCYKSFIKDNILTSEVYNKETLDKNNLKVLQNLSKNKNLYLSCFITFENNNGNFLQYKKEIVQTIVNQNVIENFSKKKELTNELYYFSKDIAHRIYQKKDFK